jgi:hypothetical protein
MQTEAETVPSSTSTPSASPVNPRTVSTARVRAHRERRRLGVHCVRVPVSKTIVGALVRLAYLSEDLQQNVGAIQKAVRNYVADAPYLP